MSSGGVDHLIDELFPEKRKHNQVPTSSGAVSSSGYKPSAWDEDSDEEKGALANARASAGLGVSRVPAHVGFSHGSCSAHSTAHPTTVVRPSVGHSFDDSSDDEENNKAGVGIANRFGGAFAPAHHSFDSDQPDVPTLQCWRSCPVIYPVPFPSLSCSEGSFSCAPRCYLTNRGARLCGEDTHPTLQQLRELAVDERSIATCTRAQMMLKKGAFYAVLVNLGNGCLDHHGDCTTDGGCTNILCHKCNYMVVRLQGAEWDDNHGEVNLYLTLRNYYPDWCRLASATPVGVEDGQNANRHVLKVNAAAAAYCCQCSWVTVRSAKAVVETKLADVFLVKAGADGHHPFATEMPLVEGEQRRPPLWVCHGHPQ